MKILIVLVGIGLLLVGPATLVTPDLAASAFGIPAETVQARGYLLATATRDVALGSWLLALLGLRADRRTLAVSIFAIAIVALGDAINVAFNAGWASPAVIVHASGLFLLVGLGCFLWRVQHLEADVAIQS